METRLLFGSRVRAESDRRGGDDPCSGGPDFWRLSDMPKSSAFSRPVAFNWVPHYTAIARVVTSQLHYVQISPIVALGRVNHCSHKDEQ